MAEPRDDRVSSAYRELPGEGPSPALDAAILAAARRAAGSRPGGARRWQIPVSIAAVLALAVGIALHVDRERPMVADGTPVSSGSAEYPVPQEAAPAVAAPAARTAPATPAEPRKERSATAPAPTGPVSAPTPPAASPPAPEAASEPARAAQPAASPPTALSAPAPRTPAVQDRAAAGAAASAQSPGAAPLAAKRANSEFAREATSREKAMGKAMETPERRLERIASLRARGLHEEADRELAAFRRELPDYRVSEEWLRRIERR